MNRRFKVVVPRDDGGVAVYPLKEWLRQHSQSVPAGLHATSSTSHELRNGLRKLGWTVQETPSEVRLIPPGAAGGGAMVKTVLGDDAESAIERDSEPDDDEAEEA